MTSTKASKTGSMRARRLGGASMLALACLAGASISTTAPAQPAPAEARQLPSTGWGVQVADVTPDPAIRYGQLPNGMKYAIMRNAVPKGGASVRLHFDFGSLSEREDERGLAHFIEHMAFNGSKNVPEGEMVKILERQGLKFGPDTNAVTGFDFTMYMLDLPQADDQRLDTAMMLMREVAGNLGFDPAAVDRERGVLLGERRSRDTFQLHQVTDQFGFMMPGARYHERLPIGTAQVIQSAPAERLKALYQRYYRPENATFLFVGDADPAAIEARIRETFSDWRGTGEAGESVGPGTIDLGRPSDFDTFVDPAAASQITINSYQPWVDPADTMAERRKQLVEALARGIFNRRMQRIVSAPDSVLLHGSMSEGENEDLALSTSLTVVSKDGAWAEGLQIAEQELRRALDHGFTQSELDLQRADFRGQLKTAAGQSSSRQNSALASAIVGTIGRNTLVTAPEWNLAFFEQIADSITVEEVNSAVDRLWSGSAPLVHVASKTPLEGQQVASAFRESRQAAVSPPVEQAAIQFAYDDFGTPGRVVDDRRVEDLGVRTVRFANNVKLNIKPTDFEPGKVGYSVRMAGGPLILPRDKPGLGVMLSSMSALSATGKHSVEDLRTLTAGRQVSAGILASGDAFVSQGSTTPADLDLQMKISAAYLTDPGLRPEATSQWRNVAAVLGKQFAAVPKTLLDTRLPYLLTQGDGRFGFPPSEALVERSFDELAPVLKAAASTAPIEVTIVGDISEQAAIEAVAATFGALPPRAMAASVDPALRRVAMRSAAEPIALTHGGDADQAVVGSLWPTDDDADYRKVIGLQVLKEVMNLNLTEEVRERLGASYGVSTASTMSDVYDDYGYLTVNTVVAPDKADEVNGAIAQVAGRLREEPVDADLLARAKNPILESIAKNLRENGYWLSALDEAQSQPERLDRIRQRRALVEAITPAEIQQLARTYLVPEKRIALSVLPDPAKPAQDAVR